MGMINWLAVNGVSAEVLPADGSSDVIDDFMFGLYFSDQQTVSEEDFQFYTEFSSVTKRSCLAHFPSEDNVPASLLVVSYGAPSLAYSKEVIANFYFLEAGKRVDFLSVLYPVLNQGDTQYYGDVSSQLVDVFTTSQSSGGGDEDNILVRTGGIDVSFIDQDKEFPYIPPKKKGYSSGLSSNGELPVPVYPDDDGSMMSGQRNNIYSFFNYSNGDNPFKNVEIDRDTLGYMALMNSSQAERLNDITVGFGETPFG